MTKYSKIDPGNVFTTLNTKKPQSCEVNCCSVCEYLKWLLHLSEKDREEPCDSASDCVTLLLIEIEFRSTKRLVKPLCFIK